MFGSKPMSQWVAEYALSHQHPINRTCHTVGIPLIAASVIAAIGSGAAWALGQPVPSLWWYGSGAAFVFGWVLQFIGHAVEGKPPEFFRDWRFLFVGLRWWVAKMRGRA